MPLHQQGEPHDAPTSLGERSGGGLSSSPLTLAESSLTSFPSHRPSVATLSTMATVRLVSSLAVYPSRFFAPFADLSLADPSPPLLSFPSITVALKMNVKLRGINSILDPAGLGPIAEKPTVRRSPTLAHFLSSPLCTRRADALRRRRLSPQSWQLGSLDRRCRWLHGLEG